MFGTDFELFMRIGGHHVPVPPVIDIGSKHGEHLRLSEGTMHRDNVMVELCAKPAIDPDAMVNTVVSLVQEAEHSLSKLMGESVELCAEPAVLFGEDLLATEYAQEIGCDRDWLARGGEGVERMPITTQMLRNYRCSGGHVHLSYGASDDKPEPVAIHLADLTLGTLETTMGSQGIRRGFYGMPGLYRPRNYGLVKGVEYRTPSNLWLATTDRIKAMATNALSTERVLRQTPTKKLMDFLYTYWPLSMTEDTVAGENTESAKMLLGAVASHFPEHDWVTGV